MSVAVSSGATSTAGGAWSDGRTTSSHATTPAGAGPSPRTRTTGGRSAWSASAVTRSGSATSTRAPACSSAPASWSPVHHALSGTATRPATIAAQNATVHSGTLRIAMATRSPGRSPCSSTSHAASPATERRCSP